MAESLADKLKRVAAEKKAARLAAEAAAPTPEPEVTSNANVHNALAVTTSAEQGEESSSLVSAEISRSESEEQGLPSSTSTELVSQSSTAGSSDHPLAMEFAELESSLLARDPEFKLQLRKIHKHLGQDPELVTQMTEEEIAMIVTGLVLFANTEIVEPAKAKTAKAAVAAVKKRVISADDL